MVAITYALPAFLLALRASAQVKATPCFDGTCQKCADTTYKFDQGWPKASKYDKFDMKGYNSSALAQGYTVYWNIEQPDDGCRVNIYEDMNVDHVEGGVPGNLILTTNAAGCFFASMKGTRWSTSFCCGDGDCASALPLGSTAPPAKRDVIEVRNAEPLPDFNKNIHPSKTASAIQVVTATPDAKTPKKSRFAPLIEDKVSRRANAIARRSGNNYNYCPGNTDKYDCTDQVWTASVHCDTAVHTSYQEAARQKQASSTVNCPNGANCLSAHSESVAVGSTLTSDHSVTKTDSNGMSVSISADFTLLKDVFSVGASTTYSHEWSKSVMDSTGSSNSTTMTTANTYTIPSLPGVKGYIYFTPTMNCAKLTTTCNDVPIDLTKCEPAVVGGSKEPQGEYGFVSTN